MDNAMDTVGTRLASPVAPTTDRERTPNCQLVVAFSGGADSTCLLHLLRGQNHVVAAHYNHNVRAEAAADAAHCRAVCGDWNVPFVCETAENEEKKPVSSEASMRRRRYDFLLRVCAEVGASRLATAHTADDNAETVLLNLTRGTGLRGLGGIAPTRDMDGVTLIRPLLGWTRADVLQHCTEHRLPFVTDSSNHQDTYRRNRLRHHVLPLLNAENPNFVRAVCRTATLLREDEEFLQQLAREQWTQHGKSDPTRFPCAVLDALARPLASRVVRLMAAERGVRRLEEPHVAACLRLCMRETQGKEAHLPGLRAKAQNGFLVFSS